MKKSSKASVLALAVLLGATLPGLAQDAGSAKAAMEIIVDGQKKNIELDAMTHSRGRGSGKIVMKGQVEISGEDVDGAGARGTHGRISDFSLTVDVDCMTVTKNRAIVGGLVRQASHDDYVGRRALFAIEDNGDGLQTPDRIAWGFYPGASDRWIAVDSERGDDDGVVYTWTATDAERPDEAGVPSGKKEEVDCKSFGFSAFTLLPVPASVGTIQVQP